MAKDGTCPMGERHEAQIGALKERVEMNTQAIDGFRVQCRQHMEKVEGVAQASSKQVRSATRWIIFTVLGVCTGIIIAALTISNQVTARVERSTVELEHLQEHVQQVAAKIDKMNGGAE